MPSRIIFTLFIFTFSTILAATDKYQDPSEGCTIGVASGRATSDGRPLLWKTRDANAIDNAVYFNNSYAIKFVCVITSGLTSSSWMGVNELGFAIINSASTDLPAGNTGMGNGAIMAYALGTCATVTEFQHLLDSTNLIGRQTQANFGVTDSTGAAAIFETGAEVYWKFDANDTLQAPDGYVLRTNFAINGGGSGGIERYLRTCQLIAEYCSGDSLNHRSILRYQMRDFSDYDSNPFSIPYPYQIFASIPFGYIYTDVSICRSFTVSTAVIHGIQPGENTRLSTLWVILGQPAGGIAVPYWPVGSPPAAANGVLTAPLCDVANLIKAQLFNWPVNPNFINTYRLLDGQGDGLWTQTFPAEDSILASTKSFLQNWRSVTPSIPEMLAFEDQCANYALNKLQKSYNILLPIDSQGEDILPENIVLHQNYPNPFNPNTMINYQLPMTSNIELSVYNQLGHKVATLVSERQHAGQHQVKWNASHLPSGVYLYQLTANRTLSEVTDQYSQTRKMILIK